MQKILGRLLCVLAVVAVLMPASPALGQSSLRTTIRDGDVWTLTSAEFGGFVGIMISWIKKADFDLHIEAQGQTSRFYVCHGLSTQDGFERCHFGQGNTKYYVMIESFSGAKKAKGALWVMFSDESRTWNRTDSGDETGLRYLGNIYEPGDDPVLLDMARREAERSNLKTLPQR